jgi:hypothetical protein
MLLTQALWLPGLRTEKDDERKRYSLGLDGGCNPAKGRELETSEGEELHRLHINQAAWRRLSWAGTWVYMFVGINVRSYCILDHSLAAAVEYLDERRQGVLSQPPRLDDQR